MGILIILSNMIITSFTCRSILSLTSNKCLLLRRKNKSFVVIIILIFWLPLFNYWFFFFFYFFFYFDFFLWFFNIIKVCFIKNIVCIYFISDSFSMIVVVWNWIKEYLEFARVIWSCILNHCYKSFILLLKFIVLIKNMQFSIF